MKKQGKEGFGRLLWILLLLITLISITAISHLINGLTHKGLEFSVYTFYCISMSILGFGAVICFFLRNKNTPQILIVILLLNLAYTGWLNILGTSVSDVNYYNLLFSMLFFGALILYILKSPRVQKIFS